MAKNKYYCGANYFPRFVRKFLSHKFNDSCKMHDEDYEAGIDRKKADEDFLISMLAQAKNRKRYKVMAHMFFWGVRIGGIFSFKRKKD